ncbi:hypothetical protein J6590_063493 [Homalodisca vitripennis]|nr:hypothetical protein J6590_063493 [Homalodisca vitripennis]
MIIDQVKTERTYIFLQGSFFKLAARQCRRTLDCIVGIPTLRQQIALLHLNSYARATPDCLHNTVLSNGGRI